jgi:hypothetical protein
MALDKEGLEDFIVTISSLAWNLSFEKMCNILKIDADDRNLPTIYKWNRFQELNQSLNSLGIDTLWTLVEEYRSINQDEKQDK